MNNLHISLNEFLYPSRVLKQVSTLSTLDRIDNIFIAALHAPDLKEVEKISEKILLQRFKLKTRSLSKNIFFQIIKYIEFVIKILLFYKEKKIKIINVHSLHLLPLGYLFKLFYGSKLIYDTHELETERNGLTGIRQKLARLVENLLIYKVDHIFVVSNNIANWYCKNYDILRPTVIFNTPKFQHLKKNDYFRKKLTIRDNQVIFLYQGGLQQGRGIELLIDYFKNRKDDRAIIIFMGYGIFEKKIRNEAKLYNTIFFHDAVDPSILMQYTSSADVGIALIENTSLSYDYCMPNKLFEYVMAGLPVIVSDVKEMSEFVQSNNIGLVVNNNEIESLNYAINEMISKDLNTFRVNIKRVARQNSWEHQEINMIKVYKKLIS